MKVPACWHHALLGFVFTLFVSIFDTEDGGYTFLGNSGTYQTNYVAPHPRTPTLEYLPLWGPQILWSFLLPVQVTFD